LSSTMPAGEVILALLLIFGCTVVHSSAEHPASVIDLNDGNFEHLTQATTGSTTGDWFINFYSPDPIHCWFCKPFVPTWIELSRRLINRIAVARIDTTTNVATRHRFGISRYPTLLFLKNGKAYRYDGDYTAQSLEAFALGEWIKATAIDIPTEVSFVAQLWEDLQADMETLYQYKKLASGVIFGMGVLVGAVLRGLVQPAGGKKVKKD